MVMPFVPTNAPMTFQALTNDKSRGNKNIVEGKGSDGCGKNGSATSEDGHGLTIGHRDR